MGATDSNPHGELGVVVDRLDKHVNDHTTRIYELAVTQAVQRETLNRFGEEMNRLRSENNLQYERMNTTLNAFQVSVNNLTNTLNQREGENRARAKWAPWLLGMIGTVIGAISLALGFVINGGP